MAQAAEKRKRSTIYFTFFHVFYCRTVSRPKCAESGQTVETGEADETLAHSPLANNSNFKGPTVALLPDFACKGNPPGPNYPPLSSPFLRLRINPYPSTFQKFYFSPHKQYFLTRSELKMIKVDTFFSSFSFFIRKSMEEIHLRFPFRFVFFFLFVSLCLGGQVRGFFAGIGWIANGDKARARKAKAIGRRREIKSRCSREFSVISTAGLFAHLSPALRGRYNSVGALLIALPRGTLRLLHFCRWKTDPSPGNICTSDFFRPFLSLSLHPFYEGPFFIHGW